MSGSDQRGTVSGSDQRAPLLCLEHLAVTFNTPKGPVFAVSDMSLQVAKGETVGIVGESGSGKSVTMKAIMGLLPRTATVSGTATYMGADVFRLSKARRKHFYGVDVAMIFQNPMTSLNPVKRVGTQLTEGMRYHGGLSKTAATKRAIELLNLVRIPSAERRLKQYPHELSGGMRQRVVIAMALANDPALLIADEPTTALDVTVQREILNLLDQLRREMDMAMILITHDLGVVRDRTDNIVVMYGGRRMESARTVDLFSAAAHPYSEALRRSIPDMSMERGTRLTPIAGAPPDLAIEPTGCPFAPRCDFATENCFARLPVIESVEGQPNHAYACFHPRHLSSVVAETKAQ